jgi:hypothetical protein
LIASITADADVLDPVNRFIARAFDNVGHGRCGGKLIVRMQLRDLTLPAFQLPAGVTLTLTPSLSVRGSGSRSIRLEPTFNDMPEAGFSCLAQGVVVPK